MICYYDYFNFPQGLRTVKLHDFVCFLYYFLGEAMEKGLRDCCRSIRIGKILIKINDETKTPMVRQHTVVCYYVIVAAHVG